MITNVSLFDSENEGMAPKVRDMNVGHATVRDVTEFCERYHYTASGGNMMRRYGLWHGPTLWGVVAYNLPTGSVAESMLEGGTGHIWHMGRLVLPDHALPNSESRLIGGSLRLVQRDEPHVWAVVTYAATDVGHIGYVYQATNALYTGTGGDPYCFIDPVGRRRPANQTKHVDSNSRRISVADAVAKGWARHDEPPKHRYVYILGSRTERRARLAALRWPILPYPKSVGGA